METLPSNSKAETKSHLDELLVSGASASKISSSIVKKRMMELGS